MPFAGLHRGPGAVFGVGCESEVGSRCKERLEVSPLGRPGPLLDLRLEWSARGAMWGAV